MRVKVHPLFFLFLLLYTLFAGASNLCAVLLALVIHEASHLKALEIKGYKKGTLALAPFGAVIYTKEELGKKDTPFVALAGPLSNLLTAIFLTALWWIAPSIYPLTHRIATASLILGIVNLLPVLPLDGGRAITAFFKGKGIEKLCRIGNPILATFFLVAFVIGIVGGKYNFTFLVFGVFILAYPLFNAKKKVSHIFRKSKDAKLSKIEISENTTLAEIIKLSNRPERVIFTVLDGMGKTLGVIKEKQIGKLAGLDASATAKRCLDKINQ